MTSSLHRESAFRVTDTRVWNASVRNNSPTTLRGIHPNPAPIPDRFSHIMLRWEEYVQRIEEPRIHSLSEGQSRRAAMIDLMSRSLFFG